MKNSTALVEALLARGARLLLSETTSHGSRFGREDVTEYYLSWRQWHVKIYQSVEDGTTVLLAEKPGDIKKKEWRSLFYETEPRFAELTPEERLAWTLAYPKDATKELAFLLAHLERLV